MARVALVTGASGGIGRAIGLALAGEGINVGFHYRTSRTEAEAAVAEARQTGVDSCALAGEVTDPQDARSLVEAAASVWGRLDIVVNNVGDYLYKPVEDLLPAEWEEILDSNLNSVFYVTQAALPYLQDSPAGRVINLGYAGAQNLLGRTHITPYAIAKTGVIVYSKALAKRMASKGVTVNVVAPGVAINSVRQPLDQIPAGRAAALGEIAQAALFFAREESGYLTGQVLEVAGGWNL